MAYKFELPKNMLKDLWRLREYAAQGPIISQVRNAVGNYLKDKEREIGTTIQDASEVIEQHRRESENHD